MENDFYRSEEQKLIDMQVMHVSDNEEHHTHEHKKRKRSNYRLLGVLLLGISIVVAANYYIFSSTKVVILPPTQPTPVLASPTAIPTKTEDFFITSTTQLKDWKTYVDEKKGIAFSYPQDWVVVPLADGTIRITPVSVQIDSLAQRIMISITPNPQNLSVEDYVAKTMTPQTISYAAITINGVPGKRTSDLPGEFDSDTVLIAHDKKIYQIRLLKTTGTKISTDEFTQFLRTVIIH